MQAWFCCGIGQRQQIQILFGPLGRLLQTVRGGGEITRSVVDTVGAVHVRQPSQQFALGCRLRDRFDSRLGGEALGFDLFGGACDGKATLEVRLNVLYAAVCRFQHQADGVFTLTADRAFAIAVPVGHDAVGRKG